MYSYILTAHNLSQRHEYGVLAREGLLIELAGIGWVARDHVQTPEQRARVISYVHGHSIVASHSSAYWIYTGNVIPELSRSLHLCNAQQSRSQGFPRNPYDPCDLTSLYGITITTPERTAIDLLRSDLPSGFEALMALLRIGANYDVIVQRGNRLRYHPGIKNVRDLLCQLPADLDVIANSHSGEAQEFLQLSEADLHPSYFL
ncbi:hypothetical protein [Arcanobacterium haemolyticum]